MRGEKIDEGKFRKIGLGKNRKGGNDALFCYITQCSATAHSRHAYASKFVTRAKLEKCSRRIEDEIQFMIAFQ